MRCHVSPSLRCFVVSSISVPANHTEIIIPHQHTHSIEYSPIIDLFSFSRQDCSDVRVAHRSSLSVQNRHEHRPCDDYAFRLDPRCHRCCAAMSWTFESFSVDNVMPTQMVLMFVHRNHDVFLLAIDLDMNLHGKATNNIVTNRIGQ